MTSAASRPDNGRGDPHPGSAGPGDPGDPGSADGVAELPALTDLSVAGFDVLAEPPGARSFTPGQVRRWVLQRGARDFDAMTDLAVGLRRTLAERWRVRKGRLHRTYTSADGTLGLVTRLADGRLIESVAIPDGERHTLCLSSQVGCAVACRFCASGLEGVERNLSPGEIIEQIFVAREASERAFTNYVFMGSGEPTHNLKHVLAAIDVMNAKQGLGIGARRITVSTIGHPEALERLAEAPIPFGIALSLHVADDDSREQLMPGLGKSRLDATLAAAEKRFAATGRRLTAEVVLLAGLNDSLDAARQLADLLAGRPVAVNVIPWNPVDGVDLAAPTRARVDGYVEALRARGITTTVRRPRGQDVGVACGQLRRHAARGES